MDYALSGLPETNVLLSVRRCPTLLPMGCCPFQYSGRLCDFRHRQRKYTDIEKIAYGNGFFLPEKSFSAGKRETPIASETIRRKYNTQKHAA
jgi:hypothetical protein